MVAIQFDNFSPQAFERLAQAICVKVFGPGTIVFGSGPDGAREASFEGEVPFPSSADRWDGYIVVQAKCREELRNNSTDAKWLCQQLKGDLEKFLSKARALRRPEFFLLISNVALSSVADRGGKVAVQKVFEEYAVQLGLKGWAVWSADELRALLDNAESIRRSYAAWLTPSDVLANLVAGLERPNLKKLLPLALARDLRDERDVRLKDAGQETDKAIFLEKVFIDLPLVDPRHFRHLRGFDQGAGDSGRGNSQDIVASILKRAREKLDPDALEHMRERPLRNRIVILGGPGQGKSTLSQFLMQLERARLLSAHEPSRLNPQTRDLIDPLLDRAREESLSLDRPLRFPIRVNLPDFADALNDESNTSLLAFIATRISKGLDFAIPADDLRLWLGECPALIVLDGLDEVPPTANRKGVLDAIDSLWDDLYIVHADVLIIVTTRPQGYNHDLDPEYWSHWELAPLAPEHVVKFSQRLADVRLSDTSEQAQLVGQLEVAARDDSTKALLTSPLQVAIMFGIVLLKGAVPKDRWELFDRYYTLLRDREAQKPSSIVREYKRQIDVLHQEVGFLLHVSAERSGGSDSYISPDQFNSIIRRLLEHEDFPSADVARISNEIERTATDRLVFLAARVSGRIAFDVRSLQEFMAASQLTSASSVNLVERLRSICTSSHWRNVFRMAASKIFSVADFGHYRDDVVAICHGLDAGDLGDEFRVTRAGARLALELLGDGLASSAPRFRKSLLRRSLALLDISPSWIPSALLSQLTSENMDIVEDEVVARLNQSRGLPMEGALKFLFSALEVLPIWSENLILRYWPDEPMDALRLFSGVDLAYLTPKVRERLLRDQWHLGPLAANKFLSDVARELEGINEQASAMPLAYIQLSDEVAHDLSPRMDVVLVPLETEEAGDPASPGLEVGIVSVKSDAEYCFSAENKEHSDAWAVLRAVGEFSLEPSALTLAGVFRALNGAPECAPLAYYWPWIIGYGTTLASEGKSYCELASDALSGNFGDIEDWVKAERRWRKNGITKADLLELGDAHFSARNVGARGAPIPEYLTLTGGQFDELGMAGLIAAAHQVSQPLRQFRLVDAILFMVDDKDLAAALDLSNLAPMIVSLIRRLPEPSRADLIANCLRSEALPTDNAEIRAEFDGIGRSKGYSYYEIANDYTENLDRLVQWFSEAPVFRGLLVPISKLLIVRQQHGSLRSDSRVDVKTSIRSISSEALVIQDSDTKSICTAIAILKVRQDKWKLFDVPNIANALSAEDVSEQDFLRILKFIEASSRALPLLLGLTKHGRQLSNRKVRDLAESVKTVADKKISPLANKARRKRLALPSSPT